MKLRTLGTGSKFCRHPLIPACFAIEAPDCFALIGAPAQAPARLEALGKSIKDLDMLILLDTGSNQTAGIEELCQIFEKQSTLPYLVAPQRVLSAVNEHFADYYGIRLSDSFNLRATLKITIKDQHHDEELVLVPHPSDEMSYGLRLPNSGVFISGNCELNEDWLFKEMQSEIILHQCSTGSGDGPGLDELGSLPIYLQNKLWLYGYHNNYQQVVDPLPMLFVPQNAVVFDSERRDKWLSKERYIRENSKRILNNV